MKICTSVKLVCKPSYKSIVHDKSSIFKHYPYLNISITYIFKSLPCGWPWVQFNLIEQGEEVTEQLYNFEDKGGRRLSLRPEMTPSLARMVMAQNKALAFPIKWYV